MKNFTITMPGRINILGNPSDANEGAYATISAAINIRAGARAQPADVITLETLKRDGDQFKGQAKAEFTIEELGNYYKDNQFKLTKAAITGFMKYSDELCKKLQKERIHLATWTDIPLQSGLGGSSVLVLVTLAALREFYELDNLKYNDYVLAEITQRIEENELNITCGFADRYVPLFGDIAYIDYRGKLHHEALRLEPYATYEKLGQFIDDIPLVLVFTGIEHESGDIHRVMRGRYLEEYKQSVANPQGDYFMVKIMEQIGATAWKGKIALLEHDWKTFGQLMDENHRLVNEMMCYCGFEDGAGAVNNLFIDAAKRFGALGAKLTGAGGGGSIFALVEPGSEQEIMAKLSEMAHQNNLTNCKIVRPQISKEGLGITSC